MNSEEQERQELIYQTLEAGLRAMGGHFPVETYKSLLARGTTAQIEAVKASFDARRDQEREFLN